ncbi:MAG TPA: hypothetical protein VK942_22405, partial [Actinomycetes bacterium]|nr:hypothetical protein [Actinomycetes bacterium]
PGVVYRRDAIDRLHSPTPHQLDLWRITRRPLGHHDLEQMAGLLVEALTPGRPWRWEARVHPPWRPVSAVPPVRRDLSVAVDADEAAEDLCDRVREALGADADAVEEVAILTETPCHQLPAQTVARLGIRQGQTNVLVRLVLRHLDRTLTDEEANRLRDPHLRGLAPGNRPPVVSPIPIEDPTSPSIFA